MLTHIRRDLENPRLTGCVTASLWMLAASGLALSVPACALDYGAGTTAPEGPKDTSTSNTDTADTEYVQADAGDAPHLTDAHSGWKQTDCFGCHGSETVYPHEDFSEPDCGACHGYNGAVHTDHASLDNPGCNACHNAETVPHFDDFAFPDDCVQCHNHPGSL